jgi:hypothetical protein
MKKDSPKDLTALDQKANETLEDILSNKKAALGDKQEVSSVREAVKQDFNITTKGEEYSLIKQMEAEAEASKMDCPATNSALNEIKDHQSKRVDGRGGGNPQDEVPKEGTSYDSESKKRDGDSNNYNDPPSSAQESFSSALDSFFD